jgi:HEPN domain-containing protein
MISVMHLEYRYLRESRPVDKIEHDLQDMEYVSLLSRADAILSTDRLLCDLARAAFPEKDVFSSLAEVPDSYRCDWADPGEGGETYCFWYPTTRILGRNQSPLCTRVGMDIEGQVEYWKTGSAEDLAAAESLLEKGHLRHCLFFAHLALEKMLKAHVTQRTKAMPPRIHSLPRLVARAGLELNEEQMDFLREFGVYQIEGRYPDAEQVELDQVLVRAELGKAWEVREWLSRRL